MKRTIDEGDLEINNWITGNYSTESGFLDAVEGGLDEFLGNRSTDDLVLQFDPFALFLGLQLDDGMPILTTAS